MYSLLSVTLEIGQQAQRTNVSGANTTFGEFLSRNLAAIMAVAVILVLLYLVWGAIEWITAGGDSSKIQKGRDKIVQAVIGIIVLASTIALFGAVQSFLGIRILQFGRGTPPAITNTAGPNTTQGLSPAAAGLLTQPIPGNTNQSCTQRNGRQTSARPCCPGTTPQPIPLLGTFCR